VLITVDNQTGSGFLDRLTVAAMPSKGLRRTSLSTDTKLDADDNARKPLKPLLGIGAVSKRFYLQAFLNCFPYSFTYNTLSVAVISNSSSGLAFLYLDKIICSSE